MITHFKFYSIIFLSFLLLIACKNETQKFERKSEFSIVEKENPSDLVVAFGSCNHQNKKQPLWKSIAEQGAELWLWLGDNIYGDSKNMEVLEKKYNKQKSRPAYQRFLETGIEIMGTWDDHDYGVNDGGKNFEFKEESSQLALDFLDYSEDAEVRKRPGVYNHKTFESSHRTVEFVLLDTRYFRDDTEKIKGVGYTINELGDILGEEQWTWLEEQVNKPMDYLVIGSSIQVIPEDHIYEKWSNFPASRTRLLDLLSKAKAEKVLILSGDRHLAEISEIVWKDRKIIEVTSSGMTHSYENVGDEPNRHRVSKIVSQKNFGTLRFIEDRLQVNILGVNGMEYIQQDLDWSF